MREIEKRNLTAAVCATLLSGWAATAAADDITTTISGYGTLGGTFTSDTQLAYHHDSTEFKGAAEQFDIGLDSRFGLQAVVDFGAGFSVTAQELIRERGADAR
jgi:carbohydrate-selective porin OprB